MISRCAWEMLNIFRPDDARKLEALAVIHHDPGAALRASLNSDPEWLVELRKDAMPFILENTPLFVNIRD